MPQTLNSECANSKLSQQRGSPHWHVPKVCFCEIARKNRSPVIQYGRGGSPTTMVFGLFQFDPVHVQPLARLLPPLTLVKADHEQSLTLHTSQGLLASEM